MPPRRKWAIAASVAALVVVAGLVGVVITRQVNEDGSASSDTLPIATSSSANMPTGRSNSVPSLDDFPGPSNTGVPEGIRLNEYTEPCALTIPGTVIDRADIKCETLVVQAKDISIARSRVNSRIDVDGDYSLSLTDVEIDAGGWGNAAIGFNDLTLKRVNVHGGGTSVNCYDSCLIEDSWLHGQFLQPDTDQHLGGYLSSGGGSNVVLRHNTIVCDVPDNATGGGCTGDAQIFGDFGPLKAYTFDSNLFKATPGGYCASFGYNPAKPYGSNPEQIVVIGNIFERGPTGKCAQYGATTSFLATASGSVWKENIWDDGTPINP